MPNKPIEAIDEIHQNKRKELISRWDAYYQSLDEEMKRDLEDLSKDPYESEAAKKIASVVSHILGIQYNEAKQITMDWLRERGIKDLSKSAKPGWKQCSALVISTLFSTGAAVAGFAVPVAGLTGTGAATVKFAGELSGVAGHASDKGTSMMKDLESSEQTTKQYTTELAKQTSQDIKDSEKKAEEMAQRHLEERRRQQQIEADAVASVLR
ncbi:hypothetical protein PHSC3_000277 [Chlamydiales bacterium STE3]|nr:hypothetical protein PHSC3_000277 [Chlamydiales bacterium STE3]